MIKRILFFSGLTMITSNLFGQGAERIMGPIIKDFGPVFRVENPDFKTDTTKDYKVVFDIYNTPEDPTKVNPMLNTLARFLNMHAGAGVPICLLYTSDAADE